MKGTQVRSGFSGIVPHGVLAKCYIVAMKSRAAAIELAMPSARLDE
jgi:hypothetical protein